MSTLAFRYFRPAFLASLAVFAASAQQPTDPFNLQIVEELNAINPNAVEPFMRANTARDEDDFSAAEAGYRRVLDLAPTYYHAKRRLCGVVLQQGRRAEAIDLCRQAAAEEPALVHNQLALIAALLPATEGGASQEELQEAAMRAEKIVDDSNVEPDYLPLIAQAAASGDNLELLGRAAGRMRLEAPDAPATHYFDWLDAISRGETERARAAINESRRTGVADDDLAAMAVMTDANESIFSQAWPYVWKVGLVWLGLLAFLLVAGSLLSRITLNAAERVPQAKSGEALGIDARLGAAYKIVLLAASSFYYLSLPLILLFVGATAVAVVYGMFVVGRIPIKLALIALAVCAVTFWATLKSLVVRPDDEDPGDKLDLGNHVELRRVLDEVAEQIGTRPVDNVYLTPGADLAVMERRGVGRRAKGAEERCLILGVGVLDGMDLAMFKAILGHEYGHFSNRDTAGGGLALSARRSLAAMAQALAEGGAATWYNPAWWFLNGFFAVYQRISQGASRLQEILADRWAAFAYGARSFESGLRHVIDRSIRFEVQVQTAFAQHGADRRALTNVYAFTPEKPVDEAALAAAVEATLAAEPSAYDSHPSPMNRFRWVHALDAVPTGNLGDADREVWSLFSNRGEIEQEMTSRLRLQVATMEAYAAQAAAEAGQA